MNLIDKNAKKYMKGFLEFFNNYILGTVITIIIILTHSHILLINHINKKDEETLRKDIS